MKKIDVNCMLGHWPFRKLNKNTFEDLKNVHRCNGISHGYVSSLNSIFYNDPFEGDEELHEIIKASDYEHILTINPTLPAFIEDIKKGVALFNIKGVRIYPGYHNYKLHCKSVDILCSLLKELNLLLYLTLRLEDERTDYLIQPQKLSVEDISSFLKNHPDNSILLGTAHYHEILALKEDISCHDNVFFETSGLKDQLFIVEKLLNTFSADKLLFGSLHPLYCLKSSLLLVEKAQISESVKEMILGSNADLLNK